MWNRRDYAVLAAAALATFGITVGTFWPRAADAAGDGLALTNDVQVPTLTLGKVQVTAALDKEVPHAVVLTAKNTSDNNAAATFKAVAQVTPPTSPFSRSVRLNVPAWQEDYALNLKPGEVKAITVTLPDSAFNVPATPAENVKIPAEMRTVAGKSELYLSETTPQDNKNTPSAFMKLPNNSIIALQLASGQPAGSVSTPKVAQVADTLTQAVAAR
jgi:hypothetical protein